MPARLGVGILLAAIVFASAALPGGEQDARETPLFRATDGSHDWDFPRDHWLHDGYRTEWWYFVGFLASGDGSSRFAWQLTLFRSGLPRAPASPEPSRWAARSTAMGHLVLADLDSGEREFVQVVYREAPGLATFSAFPGADSGEIARTPGPPGTAAPWTLSFDTSRDAFTMTAGDESARVGLGLTARVTAPPLFHGPNGYHEKSPGGGASLYYSHSRLDVSGRVRLGGETTEVVGTGWLDREFGSSWLAADQVGWDWFGLTLDDGRDLMVYLLRRMDGSTSWVSGTLRDPDGRTIGLEGPEVEPLGEWTPDDLGEEGRPYPSGWRLRVRSEGLDLRVLPLLSDQENRLAAGEPGPDIPYWEGAAEVLSWSGATVLGRGFVELTGYRSPIPALLGGQ